MMSQLFWASPGCCTRTSSSTSSRSALASCTRPAPSMAGPPTSWRRLPASAQRRRECVAAGAGARRGAASLRTAAPPQPCRTAASVVGMARHCSWPWLVACRFLPLLGWPSPAAMPVWAGATGGLLHGTACSSKTQRIQTSAERTGSGSRWQEPYGMPGLQPHLPYQHHQSDRCEIRTASDATTAVSSGASLCAASEINV
mmetsp:Transcript_135653/g.377828  ORF Transcript_135653/g.377828 Transcript_135653/m.377828 type:complete len:200 (-) Transcript_135653:117-716(-)